MSVDDVTDRRVAWQELATLLVLTVGVTVVVGPVGVLVGLVATIFWYGLGVPYALAAGFLTLTAVTPEGLGPAVIVLLTLAFAALPAAAAFRTPAPSVAVATLLAGTIVFGLSAGAAYTTSRLWLAGLAVIGTFAFVVYGIHRYELVRFGLVSDDDSDSTADTDT